ncbi:MAG: tetratricopeptide repeat protein [Ignavibacteria bacterium]|nr:tetratricopeptide repeat protein [Ignavibacteria bacterium]
MKNLVTSLAVLLLLIIGCQRSELKLEDAVDLLASAKENIKEEAFERAESEIVQALPIFEAAGEETRLADAMAQIGRIRLAYGQFAMALENMERAITHSRNASDFRGEASFLLLLGNVYREMGYFQTALEQYRSSLSFSSAFRDYESVAALQLRMGESLFLLEQYEESSTNYESAVNYYREAGNRAGTASGLIGLGQVYRAQERYDEALNTLSQAQSFLDASDQPRLEGRLRLNLGLVARAQGDWNNALRHFRDGTNRLRAKRVGKDLESLLMFYLARIYQESGKLDEATKFFTDAAAVARRANDRLAETYILLALESVNEQLTLRGDRIPEYEKLAASYENLGRRFAALGHRRGEAATLGAVGQTFRRMGKTNEALEYFRRAMETLESSVAEFVDPELHPQYARELAINSRIEDLYFLATKTALELNKIEFAFSSMERMRSRWSFKLLQSADLDPRHLPVRRDAIDGARVLKQLQNVQLEWSSVLSNPYGVVRQSVIDSLAHVEESLRRELKERARRVGGVYPNYLSLVFPGIPQLSDIQSLIPRGTVVVQFIPTPEELTLFALTRESYAVRSVAISRDRLMVLVREYMSLLQDPNVYAGAAGEASLRPMTRFAQLSVQLYDTFIRPIDMLLDRNLILIPIPGFENFPFHALEKQDPNGIIRYLIEITSVDYLPSFASLKYRTAASSRIRNIIGLGNPGGKNWSIDYELRDIRSFFKEARILISMEATWNNLKSAKGDVLQLSTEFKGMHAAFPFGVIMFSDPQNIEESTEISFRDLTTLQPYPVVVLSNHYGTGRGLAPAHALLLRTIGTSDVFYNAWYSDRKSAKFFSEYFYTHISTGLAPGDAYRQALLNLIRTRDVNHPYQWGQFFHFGVG